MKRAVAYGVTVSYLPTFIQIPELLFGNPNKLWERSTGGLETHVNRRMNVWGSGGAHAIYFQKSGKTLTNSPIINKFLKLFTNNKTSFPEPLIDSADSFPPTHQITRIREFIEEFERGY